MTILIVKFAGFLILCHAAVFGGIWVTSLKGRDPGAQIFRLLGEMMPLTVGIVIVFFLGALTGLTALLVALVLLVPAALSAALIASAENLRGAAHPFRSDRIGMTLALAALILVFRTNA